MLKDCFCIYIKTKQNYYKKVRDWLKFGFFV